MITALFNEAYPPHSAAFNNLVMRQVKQALYEDIGDDILTGDLTAQLIPQATTATATIISRETAVVCGIAWAKQAFLQLNSHLKMTWHVQDGDLVKPNQIWCEVTGNAKALLTAERCALNFLQLLSAVASETRQYVEAVQHTQAKILDTRKTIPGLRLAQKYAVTIGGGYNQRLALYDGILIKENHIAAAGSIVAVLALAQKQVQASQLNTPQNISIQIEVETLSQLNEALVAGATSILLDNFSLALLKKAVDLNAGRALLEASGGVDLGSVVAIAETGVDRISIGSITKNIHAIDLSMRLL